MLEQSDGTYKESTSSSFPIDMVFNTEKSGCIDNSGNKLENSITYSNGIVNVETNSTIYCYVYFDRKENGSLILSETSGTVNKGSTHTFTVTNNLSGGALSVISNDNNIATATVSGNTVTITGVSKGSTTITITSAETSNYLSSSVTYNVTVNAMAIVSITNTGYDAANMATKLTIDGTNYSSNDNQNIVNLEVPLGTVINCYIDDSHPYQTSYIDLVKEGVTTTLVTASGNSASYDYIVTSNVSVVVSKENSSYGRVGRITITEE